MSIRQAINNHPVAATIAVAAAVVVLAVLMLRSSGGTPAPSTASGVYFTSDDGATWTAGSARDITNASPLPRVHVFKCDKDGREFAGYMQRFLPRVVPPGATPPLGFLQSPPNALVEVKKPGDKAWTPGASPAAEAIRRVSCPSKDGGAVTEVQP